jgi:glycosyltransferase 2 family protein
MDSPSERNDDTTGAAQSAPVGAGLGRKIALSVVLGVVVFAALGIFADLRAVGTSFATFDYRMIAPVLLWTLFNYVLRWFKWDYYLRKLGFGAGVSRYDSALLFTSGMVMAVTPGKIGEVFKSYLLKRINNTPISASAPIVLAERLTDGLAMLLLMAAGLNLYPPARPVFWVLLALGVGGLAALQYRPLAERGFTLLERLPVGARIAPPARAFYASSFALFSWQLLLVSTVVSIVSWFGECIAFWYVLHGFGVALDSNALLVATFVFAASTLFGLVSFLPGGLGVSEASSTGLLVLLTTLGQAASTAATIIIRFCTLWFGVSLGLVALALFERRYRRRAMGDLATLTPKGGRTQI